MTEIPNEVCEMNAYPFSVFKRNDRPCFLVSFKDDAGKYLPPLSTKKKDEAEAMRIIYCMAREKTVKKMTYYLKTKIFRVLQFPVRIKSWYLRRIRNLFITARINYHQSNGIIFFFVIYRQALRVKYFLSGCFTVLVVPDKIAKIGVI